MGRVTMAARRTRLGRTPSQTIGPFFHIGLPWMGGADLAGPATGGRVIGLTGRVLDGADEPVSDALLEIWQADPAGAYGGGADFTGFGRCATDAEGRYRFRTLFPGRAAAPDGGLQAPHVAMSVLARGLLVRLATRIYFEDGEGAEEDPILALVPAERRETLIARRANRAGDYRFDVVLQGERETVFFDV
jgi:protocatechuate 3,4-dioxygenase alpha subunit